MSLKYWWNDPDWWAVAIDRVLRSGAQALIVVISSNQLGWLDGGWPMVVSVGSYMILSFLNSILIAPKVGRNKQVPDQGEEFVL